MSICFEVQQYWPASAKAVADHVPGMSTMHVADEKVGSTCWRTSDAAQRGKEQDSMFEVPAEK